MHPVEASSLAHPVKLVIWDLDETFWDGTLADGAVSVPAGRVELVAALCRRGIVSSICSRNDHDHARRELEACGAWSYFILPHIVFEAKGAAVAGIIEQANLRPQNVLFIDDNPLNLAEARHFAPGLMTADPADILPRLLDLDALRGKDDAGLSRLNQYKTLEKKVVDQAAAKGTREDFLRASGIEVSIDIDVAAHFDRVVELVNRSNQLNFTKARLETEAEIEAFRQALGAFGAHAGVVRVQDRYGDYGVAGFFLLFNRAGGNRLEHFVFSCRVMDMGVEQFVYRRLNRPALEVVEPVVSRLDGPAVDWIGWTDEADARVVAAGGGRLTLIGGCDLLQVANYCSPDRAEYVNHMADGVITHYDDMGFILSPRPAVEGSAVLASMPCWTAEDALRFDEDLRSSETVVVSLWDALLGQYIATDDGVLVRLDAGDHGLGDHLRSNPQAAFSSRCQFLELSQPHKAALLRRCLERVAQLSPNAACRVVLGRNLGGVRSGLHLRRLYNRVCRGYAEETGLFSFIDLDEVLKPDDIIDDAHLTRLGYHRIACAVRERLDRPGNGPAKAGGPSPPIEIDEVVRRAWFRRSGAPLGPAPGRLLGLLGRAELASLSDRLSSFRRPDARAA